MIGSAKLTPQWFAKSQKIQPSLWLRFIVTAAALFICSNGRLAMLGIAIAQRSRRQSSVPPVRWFAYRSI